MEIAVCINLDNCKRSKKNTTSLMSFSSLGLSYLRIGMTKALFQTKKHAEVWQQKLKIGVRLSSIN